MIISVIYNSGYGHTAKLAQAVAKGAGQGNGAEINIISVADNSSPWEMLEKSDAIIFGSPSYNSSNSAKLRMFFEKYTKAAWNEFKWRKNMIVRKPNKRSVFMMLLLLAVSFLQPIYGQTNNRNMTTINPPYIARTSNFMAIAFHLEAKEVQKLLPAGIKIKADDKGLATAGMEMYTTDQVYGMPNFSIAFIYVEVSDFGSDNATSGNFPIWGVVNNATALQNLTQYYHFPYQLEKTIVIEKGTEQVITIGDSNGEGLTLKLERKDDKPVAAEGVALLISGSDKGQVLRTDIPWLAKGNEASVVSLEVRAGSNKVLQMIQGVHPIYGQLSANAFSYMKPVTQ